MKHAAPVIRLQWPGSLDATAFLQQYWQQRPLLFKQAFAEFTTPLPPDELAGLSLEPDTTPRLVLKDETGRYTLEHGPFEAARFNTLSDNNWSLLVTDVEKHLPELMAYLEPFQFLPGWRIDDLMVSYAPPGASVGAHVDEYDVFLLQASGTRKWSIDARSIVNGNVITSETVGHESGSESDLKLLSEFEPTDTWELEPGDMLYLPPGVAHHGIASSEDCTTWSIGFRAPAYSELVARIAELVSEQLPPIRFTDGAINCAVPGEISCHAIRRFESMWRTATDLDSTLFAQFLGRWLTESGTAEVLHERVAYRTLEDATPSIIQRAPFSKLAWLDTHAASDTNTADSGQVTLFADGESFTCSRKLAIDLCNLVKPFSVKSVQLSETDKGVLVALMDRGILYC